jgi:hypothetical protein
MNDYHKRQANRLDHVVATLCRAHQAALHAGRMTAAKDLALDIDKYKRLRAWHDARKEVSAHA